MQRSSLQRVLVSDQRVMGVAITLIIVFTVRRLTKPLCNLAEAADQLGRGAEGTSGHRGRPPGNPQRHQRVQRHAGAADALCPAIAPACLPPSATTCSTPITSLRIRAEFVDDEENRSRIIATLDEMQRMVEATLAFARDEAKREEQKPGRSWRVPGCDRHRLPGYGTTGPLCDRTAGRG